VNRAIFARLPAQLPRATIPARGNCYVTSEAIYHLIGGKRAGWKPMRMRHEGETHWFLQHESGMVLDATAAQFTRIPDYTKARGCGFLTKKPSARAVALMGRMVWQ
jgi:hypothetical protein